MKKQISESTNQEQIICRLIQVQPERKAYFLRSIEKDLESLDNFLGYRPPLHVDKGELKIKIKGFGLIGTNNVIVMNGQTVNAIIRPENFTEQFEVLKFEKLSKPTEQTDSNEESNVEQK